MCMLKNNCNDNIIADDAVLGCRTKKMSMASVRMSIKFLNNTEGVYLRCMHDTIEDLVLL